MFCKGLYNKSFSRQSIGFCWICMAWFHLTFLKLLTKCVTSNSQLKYVQSNLKRNPCSRSLSFFICNLNVFSYLMILVIVFFLPLKMFWVEFLKELHFGLKAILVYKLLRTNTLLLLFPTVGTNSRTRGHHLKVVKKSTIYSVHTQFFSSYIVNSWKKLAYEIITAESIDVLKLRLNAEWSSRECELNLYATELEIVPGHKWTLYTTQVIFQSCIMKNPQITPSCSIYIYIYICVLIIIYETWMMGSSSYILKVWLLFTQIVPIIEDIFV